MPDAALADVRAGVSPPASRRRALIHVSDVVLPVSIAAWAIGVSQTDATKLGPFGLPAQLPVIFYAGLVLLVLSAVIELAIATSSQWRMALHATVLVIMLYGTAGLVYSQGRYSWLYKTIGVIQYVDVHGRLNASIDIYQNWPGFFALAAWFDKVAGVSSPLAYARWAQLVFELAALPLLYLIYDGLSLTYRQRWMALLLYPAANWIGQDYLSPQGLGTVLSLGIMALTMRWLFTGNRTHGGPWRRWFRRRPASRPGQAGLPGTISVARVREVFQKRRPGIDGFPAAGFGPQRRRADDGGRGGGSDPLLRSGRRIGLLVTILLLFFVLTTVHELSPYIVAVQLIVLAGSRPLRPRWMPIAMLAIAIAYLLPRLSFVTSHYGLLTSLGSFFGNAAPPSVTSSSSFAGTIPSSQLLIQRCAEGLSILMWLLALAGAWRRRHSGRIVLALLALTFSPILVLFGQAYGNEGILRVYLFSLPWAAALAAAAVEPGNLRWVRPSGVRAPATAALARVRAMDARDLARLRRFAAAVAEMDAGDYARLRAAAAAVAARTGPLARSAPERLQSAPERLRSAPAAIAPTSRALAQATRALAHAMAPRLREFAMAAGAASVRLARKLLRGLRLAAARVFGLSWIKAVLRRFRWIPPTVRWARAPVALCIILAMFLLAFYGDDAFDAFSTTEVSTVLNFLQTAKPGPLYVAEDNLPASDTAGYYLWTANDIFGDRDGAPVVDQASPSVAAQIAQDSLTYTQGKQPAYVLITPSMAPYNTAYAQAAPSSFSILEKSLAASRQWKLVVSKDGTIIYELPPTKGS